MVAGLKVQLGIDDSRQHFYVLVGLFAFSSILYTFTFFRVIT